MSESSHHTTQKLSAFRTLSPLTKVAFLGVFGALVLGLGGRFLEKYLGQSSRSPQQAGGTQAGTALHPEFQPVLGSLFPNSYFGLTERADGHIIVIAGYLGKEIPASAETANQVRREFFPFLYEQKKPMYIGFEDEERLVSVNSKGSEEVLEFSNVRKKFKEGDPLALTVFFSSEGQLINAQRGLTNLEDYLKLGIREPKNILVFPTNSIELVHFL